MMSVFLQVAYHSNEIADVTSRFANPPVTVPENFGAVMDVLRRELDKRGDKIK